MQHEVGRCARAGILNASSLRYERLTQKTPTAYTFCNCPHVPQIELQNPSLERQEAEVSAPKTKKDAFPRESENQRLKRRKGKLIRIDDLIPKQDVKGGRQLLFGATDTTQATNPTKQD